MITRILAAALLSCALLAAASSAQPAAPAAPVGQWITASGNLIIEIAPCGRVYCGDVARVVGNASMAAPGQASTAPAAHNGQRIISALAPDGDHWRGRIFNRENQRFYDCIVRRRTDGALEVRPYVLLPFLGQTQIWRPAA